MRSRNGGDAASSSGTTPDEDHDENEEFFDEVEEETPQPSTTEAKMAWHHQLPFHSRLGHAIDFVQLVARDKKTHLQKTFACQLFGDRLVMFKLDLTKNQGDLPQQFTEPTNDYQHEILCTKFEKKVQDHIPKKTLTMHYMLVNGPDVPAINLQKELDKVANWGMLPAQKVSSRLELLFSTAVASSEGVDGSAIFTNTSSPDLEMTPENSNVGCGFIPRAYVERFLGRRARGTRTFAIQVRIFSQEFGIFKGMLVEKPGINKIQLPPSMQKVAPTTLNSGSKAALLVNNIHPSDVHRQVTKPLDGEEVPPVSFAPNKLKWMITSLFQSLGVSEEPIEKHVEESHQSRGRGLQHSCVVGVADPTNALPPGQVFITGVLGTDADLPELFVTRLPCTEKRDGLLPTPVTSKPDDMSRSNWEFLCNLPFGAIVFGNPLPGEPSIPSIIAGGDLDGDNFCVCWNAELLSQIRPVQPAEGEFDDGVMQVRPRNDCWLQDVQCTLADASRLSIVDDLIGELCSNRKKLMDNCGLECPDADALGRAYKDSLDVAKHGRMVRLPHHLWDLLPERVHFLLCDDNGGEAKPCCFQDDANRHKQTRKPKRTSTRNTSTNARRMTSSNAASANHHHDDLKEGDPIEIIGGTHNNKEGTFISPTPKMVHAWILVQPPIKTCIKQENVRPVRRS